MWPEAARIGIWGLGREGRSAAQFFARDKGRAITLLTDNAEEPRPDWAPNAGFLAGDHARAAIAEGRFDLIVKSPGISTNRPEIQAARQQGSRLTSCTNLWFEHYQPGNVIAVTGTKGKSTTSAMLYHMLLAFGLDTKLLGNGGTPTLDEAPGKDFTVLEMSSYQAADLMHAPSMAVLTNLYPEHTPWHGSREAYYQDKLRLVSLDPSIPVIANAQDEQLRIRLGERPNVVWYNSPGNFLALEAGLTFNGRPMRVDGTLPPGAHNLSNLAAAAAAVRQLGLFKEAHSISLGCFAPLPHRLQEFALPGGIVGVDDSISTIPEATQAAMMTYARHPLHVILGGTERGQEYEPLARFLRDHPPRGVYLLPETGNRIATALAQAGCDFPVQSHDKLESAVEAIYAGAKTGDFILLSPAAPSFGQYGNFAERGDHFRQLCELVFARPPAGAARG